MSETNVIAINFNGDKRLILINSLSYKDVTKSGKQFYPRFNINLNLRRSNFFISQNSFRRI